MHQFVEENEESVEVLLVQLLKFVEDNKKQNHLSHSPKEVDKGINVLDSLITFEFLDANIINQF